MFADLAPHCAAFIARGAEPSYKINVCLLYCWFLAMKECHKLYANSQVIAAEWRDILAIYLISPL